MMELFFYPSESSLALGSAWWERIHERQIEGEERKRSLVGDGVKSQLSLISEFSNNTRNFLLLEKVKVPVLVTNGHTDA
jgi:hypothetical protein